MSADSRATTFWKRVAIIEIDDSVASRAVLLKHLPPECRIREIEEVAAGVRRLELLVQAGAPEDQATALVWQVFGILERDVDDGTIEAVSVLPTEPSMVKFQSHAP